MTEPIEIIKSKVELPSGCQCNLVEKYRVLVVENGKKKSQYDFENKEEALQCYALLCNPNVENEDYILKEEVFLTIYYEKDIWC